jgi:hypothetical protein
VRRLAFVLALAACSGTSSAPPPAPFQQRFTTDLDLLFVVDNSSATSDEQTVFAANFPKFVQTLDAFPGGRPNLHIGVVDSTVDIGNTNYGPGCPSPDPGDDGLLVNTPRITGCSPPTGRFITDIASSTGGRTTNYSGTLDAAFSCIAQIGSTGCGFEAQLEGMKRALDGSRLENAGFLRPDANLAIMILTDEDDCSVADPSLFDLNAADVGKGDFRCQPLFAYTCDQPISVTAPGTYTNCRVRTGSYLREPQFYYDFLTSLVPAANIYVGLVAGDPTPTVNTLQITTPFDGALTLGPSCHATLNGNPMIAKGGIRLADLVDRFGDHGMFRSICESDYSAALTDFARILATNTTSGCIAGAIDVTDRDASMPGLQPACTAEHDGTAIPLCPMLDDTTPDPAAPQPCIWLAPAPTCATTPTGLQLHIVGGSSVAITCAAKA